MDNLTPMTMPDYTSGGFGTTGPVGGPTTTQPTTPQLKTGDTFSLLNPLAYFSAHAHAIVCFLIGFIMLVAGLLMLGVTMVDKVPIPIPKG